MPPGDLAPVIATSVFFIAFASVLILRGPLGRALARRIEGGAGGGADPGMARRVAELEAQVAELERRADRVPELEERLDFAERLLARQADQQRLPN